MLNMEKTGLMKFSLNMRQNELLQIIHQDKLLTGINNTTFLGLELDKNVNWKNHIHKILPKLSKACYLIRRMYTSCNLNTLMMIYLAYFHSVMEYGIIFWGFQQKVKKYYCDKKEYLELWLEHQQGPHVEGFSLNWKFWPWHLNSFSPQWDFSHLT